MTNELKEQIAALAAYAGYKPEGNREGSKRTRMVNNGHAIWLEEMNWHTSIDAMAPLAIKVRAELFSLYQSAFLTLQNERDNMQVLHRYEDTRDAGLKIDRAATTFDPLQIFQSVYAGISLLNDYKTQSNEKS